MPISDEQRLSNLIYFLQERWQPDIEGATASQVVELPASDDMWLRLDPIYLRIALFETYLWLRLGVEVDFFPVEPVRRIIEEYQPILRSAFYAREFPEDFRKDADRMEHQGLSREVHDSDPFSPASKFVFRDFLLLSNEFTRDLGARSVVQIVNFANVGEWDAVMRAVQPASGRSVPESDEEKKTAEPLREQLSSGLIRICQYVEAFEGLAAQLDSYSYSPNQLRDRFFQLQRWRLNFKDGVVWKNFERLSEPLVAWLIQREAVRPVLEEQGSDAQDLANALWTSIHVLMTDWGAPQLGKPAGGGLSSAAHGDD